MTLPIIITENGCFGLDSDNRTILFSGTKNLPVSAGGLIMRGKVAIIVKRRNQIDYSCKRNKTRQQTGPQSLRLRACSFSSIYLICIVMFVHYAWQSPGKYACFCQQQLLALHCYTVVNQDLPLFKVKRILPQEFTIPNGIRLLLDRINRYLNYMLFQYRNRSCSCYWCLH